MHAGSGSKKEADRILVWEVASAQAEGGAEASWNFAQCDQEDFSNPTSPDRLVHCLCVGRDVCWISSRRSAHGTMLSDADD